MKILYFIKKNISVFSLIAFTILIYFFYLLFKVDINDCKGAIIFLLIFISFLFLLIDFILKSFISSKIILNVIQFLIIVSLYYYFKT